MAGEYSRELSAKVFAGQCRRIAWDSDKAATPVRLRRRLVDQNGNT